MLFSVLDNIPYVEVMDQLIVDLARLLHPEITDSPMLVDQSDIRKLCWTQELGACARGNGTIIVASANVVIMDIV